MDASILIGLIQTRYLQGRAPVLKVGNLHLAWEYAQSPTNLHRFHNMLRLSPEAFQVLLNTIDAHPIFYNDSNHPQAPIEFQLAVTLYRMGRYGNGASCEDIARTAGISTGSVELYTRRCFTAIESLHDLFVRKLTPEEKEMEKKWIDDHVGFCGHWRNGWVLMYDGTIVVLYQRPGLNGESYYTRKSNYGLNCQIGCVPSSLRIVDYAHGLTGSAHDQSAFEITAAYKYPDRIFEEGEFAWADSAYTCTHRIIPVHREPASLLQRNILFDTTVSRIRVRSEHCMGALKGRFQCLRGMRIMINSNRDHVEACRWITVAIILHNFIIDVEGSRYAADWIALHGQDEKFEDSGAVQVPIDEGDPEALREYLIDELWAHQ